METEVEKCLLCHAVYLIYLYEDVCSFSASSFWLLFQLPKKLNFLWKVTSQITLKMLMVFGFFKKKSVKILNSLTSILIDASFWILLNAWNSQKSTDNQTFINMILSISLFSNRIICPAWILLVFPGNTMQVSLNPSHQLLCDFVCHGKSVPDCLLAD